jgi:dynein heavy chain 2, cytosolic
MKSTLHSLLVKCLEESKRSESGANLSSYPSQILCLSEEISFTNQCEIAIANGRLGSLKNSLKVSFKKFTYKLLKLNIENKYYAKIFN